MKSISLTSLATIAIAKNGLFGYPPGTFVSTTAIAVKGQILWNVYVQSSTCVASLVPDPAALGVLHHQHVERVLHSFRLLYRNLCEMSCYRPHACTEYLIKEILSVYSVLVRSDHVL